MLMSSQKAYFVLCLAARTAVSYFEIIKHTLSHHHMLLALWVGPKDGTLWLEEFASNIRHIVAAMVVSLHMHCLSVNIWTWIWLILIQFYIGFRKLLRSSFRTDISTNSSVLWNHSYSYWKSVFTIDNCCCFI